MDFLSLSRKELQALCKKNKIPANMTNVAMAEALKDLQTVEGLDDIMNQSQINPPRSPGNPVTGSQEIPHSITRTSTRRKPTKEEPQSLQPTTRTRRGPRRAITEEMDQENKSVNVPETPAMPSGRRRATAASAWQRSKTHVKEDKEDEKLVGQGKSDDIKTPAVQSSRRRAPAASSGRKAGESQKEEGSVQCAYSTRRSVRLLEKSMTDLSLNEKGTTEPVKIDELGKEMAVGKEKNDASGVDSQTISEESSEKANDSEVFSGRNLSESLENERDLIDDIQETDKCNDIGDDDYKLEAQADYQKSDYLNGISVLDAKDSTHDEMTDEPDVHVAEDLMEKAADVHGAFADEKGSYNLVDLSVLDAKDSTHVMADEPDVHVGEDLMKKAEDVNGAFAEEKGSGDVPVEVSDHVAPAKPAMLQEIDNFVSGEMSAVLSSTLSSCEDQDEKPDSQCQKLGIEEAYDESMEDEKPHDHFQKLAIEEACDESMEDDLRVGNDLESKFNSEKESSDEVFDEKPSEFIPSVTDDETEVESTAVSAFLGDANFLNDLGPEKLIAYQLEKQDTVESSGGHIGDQSAKKEVYNNKEFVDIDVTESEEYDLTSTDSYSPLDNSPISGKQTSPFPVVSETEAEGDITLALTQEIADTETSVDVYVAEQFSVAINEVPPSSDKTPTSVKQMSPTSPLVSGDTVTGGSQLSPFAEKSISGQFPRPTLSTATKSSSKKHTTIQNLTDVADNFNNKKENMDNCEMKVEPKNNKMIKKTIIDGDTLKGISLRKLTRMVKELEITNHTKNDEDKMVAKMQVGKSRPALQTLPENRMPAAEQQKEN